MSRSTLLHPSIPDKEYDLPTLVEKLGYKAARQDKRLDNNEVFGVNGLITKCCRLLFGLLRDGAYIGRLYQQLILYVNFKHHMLTALIIY